MLLKVIVLLASMVRMINCDKNCFRFNWIRIGFLFVFLSQVQIRPWSLADSDFVMDNSQPIDPRKTVFVGGVPRPLKAGQWGTMIPSFKL